jgi:hypothetical protein
MELIQNRGVGVGVFRHIERRPKSKILSSDDIANN